MKTLTVDYKRWGPHRLRDPETGRMCCLGFACAKFGARDEDMERNSMPICLAADQKAAKSWRAARKVEEVLGSFVMHRASFLNDDFWEHVKYSRFRDARECLKLLREAFHKAGVTLRITNQPDWMKEL